MLFLSVKRFSPIPPYQQAPSKSRPSNIHINIMRGGNSDPAGAFESPNTVFTLSVRCPERLPSKYTQPSSLATPSSIPIPALHTSSVTAQIPTSIVSSANIYQKCDSRLSRSRRLTSSSICSAIMCKAIPLHLHRIATCWRRAEVTRGACARGRIAKAMLTLVQYSETVVAESVLGKGQRGWCVFANERFKLARQLSISFINSKYIAMLCDLYMSHKS